MTNGTINDEKNNRLVKDIVSFIFLLIGLALLTWGAGLIAGWGGMCILYGLIFGGLGLSLGLSRTGKE